jgi:hypothetical protein
MMGQLLKVSHSQVKSQLEAEKAEKQKRKANKLSASDRASSDNG